jgi:hypothetical protein
MDHTNHVRLTEAELTADILEDATIYGPDDENVGSVSHVHGSGNSARITKPVAVPASQLDFMRHDDGDVHAFTAWTKDQLEEMPEHVD